MTKPNKQSTDAAVRQQTDQALAAPSVASSASPDLNRPRNILTVNLEDYYQVAAFQHLITQDQWYRFETRLHSNVQRTLELLDELEVKATFFVLGWIAERWPAIAKSLVDAGHEVGSRGYYHRDLETLTREEFREDVIQSKKAIEAATGREALGYRLSGEWLRENQEWALDVLVQEGHKYDSSILPVMRTFHEESDSYVAERQTPSGLIWEVALSSKKICGLRVPTAGGNYFRQFPAWFIRSAVAKGIKQNDHPFVMYFHTWELDADQPRIAAGRMARMRHYRNLERVESMIREFVKGQGFGPAADYLGLERKAIVPAVETPVSIDAQAPVAVTVRKAKDRQPVSIVVPCYNEEKTIPYLANTLKSVGDTLSQTCEPHFILIDDKSTDSTWQILQDTFSDPTRYSLVQHEVNQGVSAAIMTGVRASEAEVVCSIDCDCSYDPHELRNMIPLMTEGVDLVTASPYHPQGRVRNVPKWRLFLSWSLSAMYRVLLGREMYTWTSCCRVYRKSVVGDLEIQESGFLGTAELVAKLCLADSKIVEHPATLEVRIFGESKMKTFRTIGGHLRLLGRVLKMRLKGKSSQVPAQTESRASTVNSQKGAFK